MWCPPCSRRARVAPGKVHGLQGPLSSLLAPLTRIIHLSIVKDVYRWSVFDRGMVSMLGYRAQLLIQRLKRFCLWFFLVLILSYVFLLLLDLLLSPTSPFFPMPQ